MKMPGRIMPFVLKNFFPWVDYFVVNVSSPNTPACGNLQEKESLRIILTKLQELNRRQKKQKPLLLKISPDLTFLPAG